MTKDDLIEALTAAADSARGFTTGSIRGAMRGIVDRYFSESARHAATARTTPAQKAVRESNAKRFRERKTNTGIPGVHRMKSGRCQAKVGKVYLGVHDDEQTAARVIEDYKAKQAAKEQ